MVSTANGKILKSVYISKTILSQAIDQSLFKYVNFKRLLEVETGYTTNEPVQMAVTEAIEKAVSTLVLEGIKDGVWEADISQPEKEILLKNYAQENEEADVKAIYGRSLKERRSQFAIEITGGATLMDGDYSNPEFRPMARGALKYFFTPAINLSAATNVFKLANKNLLDVGYITYDLNAEYILLPKDKLSPFVFAGGGIGMNKKLENIHAKVQYGLGIEYMASENLGIKLYGEHNLNFSDTIDYIKRGIRDDYYYRFGFGVTFYFPNKNKPLIDKITTNTTIK
jgi:curli production assembly/transport component CsgG